MLVERTPRSAARAPAAQAAAAQPIAEEPAAPTVEPVELVVDKDAMLEEMESMFEMAVVKVVCTALFCCAVLCCAVLCCAVLCCAVLCCAVCGCVCACTRARNSCVWSFMRSRQIWARVFCGLLFRFGCLANAVDRNVSLRESIAHAHSHAHACKATHPFRAHFCFAPFWRPNLPVFPYDRFAQDGDVGTSDMLATLWLAIPVEVEHGGVSLTIASSKQFYLFHLASGTYLCASSKLHADADQPAKLRCTV